jgi:hypothetical protein
MKTIVILGTSHLADQPSVNQRVADLGRCLGHLSCKFSAQVVLEEWSSNRGKSAAESFAEKSRLRWVNVGTPDDSKYRTYTGPINFPGHDGTLQPPDQGAPRMDEYGPIENQEARQELIAKNVGAQMENYETCLLVLGLAHLHSLFVKLQSMGFKV